MIHKAFPGGIEDLREYVMELMGAKDHWVKNMDDPADTRWEYTYHQRLADWGTWKQKGPQERGRPGTGVDQVARVVDKLARQPFSRQAQMITWMPAEDLDAYDPPCLQSLWYRLLEDEGTLYLNCNVRFRSNDAWGANFMNMFGFTHFNRLAIADPLQERLGRPVELGRLNWQADSYHLYGKDQKDFTARFQDRLAVSSLRGQGLQVLRRVDPGDLARSRRGCPREDPGVRRGGEGPLMHTLAVLVVSAAPAIAFLVLILRMDRREPEPLDLVLKVIGLGAASALIAGLVERGLDSVRLFQAGGLAGAAAVSFLQVAPIEEACKLGVVLLFAWKKPAFNEENDGIVYAGASAMGFALLENILYVARGGIGTGLLRAFTSIPLHIFTGVVAGLFIGRARFAGFPRARTLLVAAGFLLAWAFHGLYDMFAMSGSALALLVLPLVAGVSTFGVIALKAGRRASLLRWGGAAPRPAAARSDPRLPRAAAAPPRGWQWSPGCSSEGRSCSGCSSQWDSPTGQPRKAGARRSSAGS